MEENTNGWTVNLSSARHVCGVREFVLGPIVSFHRLQFVFRLLRSSSTLPGISGAFSLCSRKEYKNTALVLKQIVDQNVLARSHASTQRARAHGGGSGLCWSWCPSCLSVMQCCISLVEGENAVTSGNDVILIAFVCCTAVQTLKIHIQPSDPAFFLLYTFTYSSALRHIDLIPSVF